MTNAEKYEEIFGLPVDKVMCPTKDCKQCPIKNDNFGCDATENWWNSEYKEPGRQKMEHSCGNCKYTDRGICDEPCSSCDICLGNNKWEAKEEDGDES